MPPNYQVEAKGLVFINEKKETVRFDGISYDIEFVEFGPEGYEEKLVREIDDHTVELTVEDPNGLV